MNLRSVATIVPAQATQDGNRVSLHRVFPSHHLDLLDPFLLMDHFGPMVLSPGTDAGFPPHPHKGFQTLTYLIQGAFAHRDSTGGHGLLHPGGAQLMTAGRGIVHEEMPVPEHLETGGPIEGIQLWINLPQALKHGEPGYRDLQPEDMPWLQLPHSHGRLKALAGSWHGIEGPASFPVPVAIAHVELTADGHLEHELPSAWNAAVYVISGEIQTSLPVSAQHLVVFKQDGDGIRIESRGGANLYVITGRPIQEPIARYGPFVMNTVDEIEIALKEYHSGRFGSLTPSR